MLVDKVAVNIKTFVTKVAQCKQSSILLSLQNTYSLQLCWLPDCQKQQMKKVVHVICQWISLWMLLKYMNIKNLLWNENESISEAYLA
jgi:hypothetical protein